MVVATRAHRWMILLKRAIYPSARLFMENKGVVVALSIYEIAQLLILKTPYILPYTYTRVHG